MKRAISVIVIVALVALAACSGDGAPEAIPASEQEIDLTLFQQLAMAAAVRRSFQIYPDFEKLMAMPKEAGIPDLGNLPVFVTVFHKAAPMIWGVGLEGDTQERLLRAAVQVMRHPAFAKTYLVDRERIAIKIDVIRSLQPTEVDKNGKGSGIEPGVHGLMTQKGSEFFFQLPTDFLNLGWESDSGSVRSRKLKMLSELSQSAGLGNDGWRDRPVYRFRTVSFLQELPDYAPVKLFRGMPVSKGFGGQDIQDGALRAGRHILQNIEDSHRFRDRFDPFENEAAGFFEYNPTQHAQGLWSLAVLFAFSKRIEIIDQTKPALLWLVQHIDVPLMEPEASHIEFFQNAKTSATAMSLLALTAMPPVVIDELGKARVNRLAYYLSVVQDDAGEFFPTYYHKLFNWRPERPNAELGALPILALARYYEVNPNVDWLTAAKAAADREIARFQLTAEVPAWGAEAMAELWRVTGNESYADAALAMGDSWLGRQYDGESLQYPDYAGAFRGSKPPKVATTGQGIHALYAAMAVAKERGLPTKTYEEAILRGAGFLLAQQFDKQNSYFLPFPDEVYGGIRTSPASNEIRLDPMSWAIVGLCNAFDVHAERVQRKLEKLKAEGKSPGGWKKLPPEELKKLEELKQKAKDAAKADPAKTP
ncbi:MAG: hypothetical protein IT350_14865 [Deltaproteobacteria bacterium]|nr:hypothetical protein [Deltaproteobacteria bacterium]